MIRRFLHFISKALGAARETPGVSMLTVGTIGAALLVAGLYVIALQNLEGLALIWGRTAMVTAYVREDVSVEARPALRQRLETLSGVEQAVLISPHEALERFKARGSAAAALVEGVTEDVLPASVELHLRGGFADLNAVENLAQEVRLVPGVFDVDYGQQEFERLRTLLDLLRYGGLAAGLLIAVAAAFIISNTIRLTVYARRDEIEILRLVGATDWFIRTPFLVEGAFWGLGGGAVAALLMGMADWLVAPQLSEAVAGVLGGLDVHLFSWTVGVGLAAVGVVLGVVGSGLAVRRFLEWETM